jgi:transposase-like protein
MSRRPRRHFSPEQKAAIVFRHLVGKVPVSQICNESELQPSVFYHWLKQFEAHAHTAFAVPGRSSRERELEEKVAALEARLARKDAVIAEVSEQYVTLKKTLGEP